MSTPDHPAASSGPLIPATATRYRIVPNPRGGLPPINGADRKAESAATGDGRGL